MADNDQNLIPPPVPEGGTIPKENPGISAPRSMGVPAVAASPARNVVFIVLFLGLVIFLIYTLFLQKKEPPKPATTKGQTEAIAPKISVPAPPPAPPTAPPVPLPPPPPVPAAPAPVVNSQAAAKEIQEQDKRRKTKGVISSNASAGGGGGAAAGSSTNGADSLSAKSSNIIAFLDPRATMKKSDAATVEATIAGDNRTTVYQGKIIDAVLETAINTDLPGQLRAVVSRDVYAESGKDVMIPKGSRLIGAYNADVKRGQARVYIIWNRVIRPDGVDVALNSPGVDSLGRAGEAGQVDEKYMEIFGNSILMSTLTIGFAKAADALTGSEGVSQTQNTSGSVTTGGTSTAFAEQSAVQNFGSVTQGLLGQLIVTKPTITVDQGTKLKVFVNRDLTFPIAAVRSINTPQ